MMVIFLCGLVALILLRTIKNDFAKFDEQNLLLLDEEKGKKYDTGEGNNLLDSNFSSILGEETGWKQLHGDVFRDPNYLSLFSSLISTGWQLFFLVIGLLSYALLGPYLHGNMYEDRGEMAFAILICYSFSFFIGGYCTGSFYRKSNSKKTDSSTNGSILSNSSWQYGLIFNILLFPSCLLFVFFILNFYSIYYEALGALPFSAIFKVLFIWLIISIPLCLVGILTSRHIKLNLNSIKKVNLFSLFYYFNIMNFLFLPHSLEPPCRVHTIPRPIPKSNSLFSNKFYLINILSGLLPFASIFLEIYFLFTALWSYKFYYIYGFAFIILIIMSFVVVFTSIVSTYLIILKEDHEWQWKAWLNGSSIGIYIFLYSIFYYNYKTQMSGSLQFIYYFSYMAIIILIISLICGTLAYWGASLFIYLIFKSVKID